MLNRIGKPSSINTLLLVTVFLFCAVSITLIVPTPVQLIQDQDWSHQLAGANQILKGEHPFSDFLATYGPLTFYASALAQTLSGTRVLGEIVLIVAGFSVAYTLLFWIMCSITQEKVLAFVLLIILIILIPRLYKYYIVLGPALTMFWFWDYLECPKRTKFCLVALGVVMTGLFRPDFGIYMVICIAITLLARPVINMRQRFFDLLCLACIILIFAFPWLALLSIKGGLSDYIYASTINAASHASGMSLPLTASENMFSKEYIQFLVKIAFNFIPGISLILFVRRKNSMDLTTRSRLLAIIIAAQLTLIQGLHRSDWGHFLQSIPMTFVLLAYLIKQAILSVSRKNIFFPFIGLGTSIGLLVAMVLFSLPAWGNISIKDTWQSLKSYDLPRAQFVNSLIQKYPENEILQVMDFIRNCTSPGEKLIAWPYLLDFYYYTDRPLGSRYIGLSPGFFSAQKYQMRAIKELADEEVRFFIYRPITFTATAINISDYVPLIAKYLDQTYIPLRQYGDITIYVRHNTKPFPACTCE